MISAQMNKPGTLQWFAGHELSLFWRDFMRMMTAGKPGRERTILLVIFVAAAAMHLLAYGMIRPSLESGILPDKTSFVMITGTMFLIFSLMMSQALEMVTRVFYARSDLDLILSSPTSVKRLFAVRVGAIAVSTTMLSLVLFAPAINVLAWYDGAQWLAGYPLLFCLGAIVTSLSLAITIGLFKIFGAKRTRSMAQIVAAIVGASFIIGIQLAAISSIGSISRIEFFSSEQVLAYAPHAESLIWLPARALMGEASAIAAIVLASVVTLVISIRVFSNKFGERVLAASNFTGAAIVQTNHASLFKRRSASAHLRHKEWQLLLRDHWLISQTLMQILYLLPPAFMLWQGFGNAGALDVVVVPVLVMATGQLSGGLAWLAISGEDAPDLVSTAPIPTGTIIRAKIEAVLGAIVMIASPILLMLLYLDVRLALIATVHIMIAAASATMIQLWFRSQAERSNFRRRQTSSKVATFAEAFSSILWAGTAGLVAAGSWFAVIPIVLALAVLLAARSFRPQGV